MKEKPAFRSQFLGAFPSDRTPKATNENNANFFICSCTFRDKLVIIDPVVNAGDFLKLLRIRVCARVSVRACVYIGV